MMLTLDVNEATASIGDLLREVSAKSGPLTEAYCAETRTKIRTVVAMMHREDRVKILPKLKTAYETLSLLQERNSEERVSHHNADGMNVTAFVASASEDPIWQQNVEALEHSLAHYGLETKRLSEKRVLVKAATFRKSFPVGGTPKEVIVRSLPQTVEVKVSGTNARTLVQALGAKLKALGKLDVLRKISQDNVSREVTFKRLDFVTILEALFAFGPHDNGWQLRSRWLEEFGIQEA